jgi:hypothetical protein
MKNSYRLAVFGLLLLLPVCILVVSSVFGFNANPVLIHPAAVIGGLLAALLLNLAATLRLQTEGEHGHVSAVIIKIGAKPVNLAVLAIGGLFLLSVLAYAFVENFRPR